MADQPSFRNRFGRTVTSVLSTAALIAASAIGLTTTVATPEASAAARVTGCTTPSTYEVCFSDPGVDGDIVDDTIPRRLIKLIDETKDPHSIRVSMYTWEKTPDTSTQKKDVAAALVRAAKRGVDVKVVIDGTNESDAAAAQLANGGVEVKRCEGSCLGTKINHNKFFLFNYDADRFSVVVTSANLTNHMLHRHNNLIKVWGDKKLYDFYNDYWKRLKKQSWTLDGVTWDTTHRTQTGSRSGVKAYVFPRTDRDPVLAILNNVTKCTTDHNKIWVAASHFTNARKEVRNRLAYLEDVLGCDVRVVVHNKSDYNTEQWVQGGTGTGHNLGNNKVRHSAVHHKFLIIDAQYDGTNQQILWTGSHNLTGSSLTKNDESMLRLKNATMHQRYVAAFKSIYDNAKNS